MKKSEIRNLNTLSLTEIKSIGWATISGRVEDYQKILESKGFKKCFDSVNKDYKEDAIEVFVGVFVYSNFGSEAYYKGVDYFSISDEYQLKRKIWNQKAVDGTLSDSENPLFILQSIPDVLLKKIITNQVDIMQLALIEADSRLLKL